MKRNILIMLILMIALSTQVICQDNASSTLNLNVSCSDPKLIPDDPTIPCGSVIANGEWQNITAVRSNLTFEGQGNHVWKCKIERWDTEYPPTGTGPKAYIDSKWYFTDRTKTDKEITVGVGVDFDFQPKTDACNAEAYFYIEVTRLKADVNFSATNEVPFVYKLVVTE